MCSFPPVIDVRCLYADFSVCMSEKDENPDKLERVFSTMSFSPHGVRVSLDLVCESTNRRTGAVDPSAEGAVRNCQGSKLN